MLGMLKGFLPDFISRNPILDHCDCLHGSSVAMHIVVRNYSMKRAKSSIV